GRAPVKKRSITSTRAQGGREADAPCLEIAGNVPRHPVSYPSLHLRSKRGARRRTGPDKFSDITDKTSHFLLERRVHELPSGGGTPVQSPRECALSARPHACVFGSVSSRSLAPSRSLTGAAEMRRMIRRPAREGRASRHLPRRAPPP